jgi:SecD/SecF fusion protein
MPGYYLLAGLVADIGLILYAVIVIGALAAISATLTLPGIAGFILSIGMAVDANVLIGERIREEKLNGKSARSAVDAGYTRAFPAILDSHATTTLTSLVLFIFGTGPVKGFAVTLSIGIIASMFSALFVTRMIFEWLIRRNPQIKLKMFRLSGATQIPFLRRRIWACGFSLLALTLGIFGFLWRGQGNFGVEFVGGTLVQIRFQQNPDVGLIREKLEEAAVKDVMIQPYGSGSEKQVVFRMRDTDLQNIESAVRGVANDQGYEIMRVERIGPAVSEDLRFKALWAILLSTAGILGYLAWRFDRIFAAAAVIALLHDTLFTLGIFALSGREISLPIVAALLTIMGYSVNDTIVTFDRVRDNLNSMRKSALQTIFESSINQTLSRTVLTSLTTLMCAAALYFFGGRAINDFAFTLLIGFSVGIYSTIFVAGALVVDWKARSSDRAHHKKAAPKTSGTLG